MNATATDLFASLDALLWDANATSANVQNFCDAAKQKKIRAVCLPGSRIEQAHAQLEETSLKIVALTSYPLGNDDGDAKRFAAEAAVDNGAHEVETVLHTGQLKEGATKLILRELRDIVEAAEERPVGVTLNLAQLTREEIRIACELILDSGARWISPSPDFWPETKISPDDVKFLRECVGADFIIKAAGGIRDIETAQAMLNAGATRVGTADLFWQT